MSNYTFALWVFIISGTVSLVLWYNNYTGSVVYTTSVPFSALDTTGVPLPAFKVPKELRACELELSVGAMPRSFRNDFFVAAEVLDETDSTVAVLEGDMYYDYGGSGEDAWSETKDRVSKYFTIQPSAKGNPEPEYEVVVFLQKGDPYKYGTAATSPDNITFTLRTADALKAEYFGWWSIIFLSIACLMLFGLDSSGNE